MEGLVLLCAIVLLLIAPIADRFISRNWFIKSSDIRWTNASNENSLPNGYSPSDYAEYGLNELDIETWGLDQPGAPDPSSAGFTMLDMLDGDLDGDIDADFEF